MLQELGVHSLVQRPPRRSSRVLCIDMFSLFRTRWYPLQTHQAKNLKGLRGFENWRGLPNDVPPGCYDVYDMCTAELFAACWLCWGESAWIPHFPKTNQMAHGKRPSPTQEGIAWTRGHFHALSFFIHLHSCWSSLPVLHFSFISLGLVQVEEDVACGVLTLLSTCFTDAKAAAARQSFCGEFFHHAFLHGNRVHLEMVFSGENLLVEFFFSKKSPFEIWQFGKMVLIFGRNSWGSFVKGPCRGGSPGCRDGMDFRCEVVMELSWKMDDRKCPWWKVTLFPIFRGI